MSLISELKRRSLFRVALCKIVALRAGGSGAPNGHRPGSMNSLGTDYTGEPVRVMHAS